MRYFGYWTVFVALSISAVAAYYSIVGLVAIFASAIIPIIIMGTVLEIGKLTSAVWLHLHWKEAPILIKTYLTVAVLMLMLITSMGIFGFLSKAHIEQTSQATENVAQIERIDESIVRQKLIITKADTQIDKLENTDNSKDEGIQSKIEVEQNRINTAYAGVQPSIDEQNAIITKEEETQKSSLAPFERQLVEIDKQLATIEEYIANNEIKKLQGLIGASQDGRYGTKTANAVTEYRESKEKNRRMVLYQLNNIREQDSTVTTEARVEIKRLRGIAEQQIADSNVLITRLRSQLGQGQLVDSTEKITTQRTIITTAEDTLDSLYTDKFSLEGESRQLEAEVGPVKYIAELIWGTDPTRNMLDDAVRFVILMLVLVFDPLAIVLVISGITLVERFPRKAKKPKKVIYEEEDKVSEDIVHVEDAIETEEIEEDKPSIEIQDEIPEEEVIHLDNEGKSYTIDETGSRKYLLDNQQYDLNNNARKTLKKEKNELVNKIVAEMRSTGSWPGAGYLSDDGVIKKRIEDIFADDASLELKELIAKADSAVLNEVYKEIIKDTRDEN
tara:strand:+ start:4656 stop:6332 length:1677 start_codon:yes stop_codon:yes gene_type:complete